MRVLVKKCEKIKDGYILELEPNGAFYIDGKGGQLGDRGSIGEAKVIEVKENGVIVDRELELQEYEIEIDTQRQEDIACQHTSQHIFSALAYNIYGLNTVGFRMAEEYTTVDLDSNTITDEIVVDLENRVNEVIRDGKELKIFIMDNDEARNIEGLRKAIKEKVTGDVRFVEIPEIDLGACAGFHVKNTKDIQLFKIINQEKVKGNYTRFYFIAGKRAIEDYSNKHKLSRELCQTFSCKDKEIIDMVDKSIGEKRKVESEYKNLAMQYSELLATKLLKESEKIGKYQPIFYFGDSSVAQFLVKYMGDNNILLTGSGSNFSISAQEFDCKEFIKFLINKYSNIKGGGNQSKGNFKGEIKESEVKGILLDYLKSSTL